MTALKLRTLPSHYSVHETVDRLEGLLKSKRIKIFARISAVLSLKRQDFYYQGARRWLRFHEKGGKEHEMPAHHEIEQYR